MITPEVSKVEAGFEGGGGGGERLKEKLQNKGN